VTIDRKRLCDALAIVKRFRAVLVSEFRLAEL
jgi:hypothetical protein